MASKPIVVVTGATGAQGGSVISALLKDGKYRIRGCTRDVNSEKAKQLAARGVDMARVDTTSKVDLLAAFKDAHAVFGGK
jgi:uncharacterized protein YbjT (DUF2867 family)